MSRRRAIETLVAWVLVAGVFVVVVALWRIGLLQRFELQVYDAIVRYHWRTSAESDGPVVLVEIGEDYLDAAPAKPAVTDDDLATMIELAREAGATVIGLDLVRNFSYPPGEERLLALLPNATNVIGIVAGEGDGLRTTGHPGLGKRVALANLVTDPDGVVRRATLSATYGQTYPTLAYALAARHLRKANVTTGPTADQTGVLIGAAAFVPPKPGFGAYVPAMKVLDSDGNGQTEGYQFMIRYADRVTRVSAADLMRGVADPGTLAGRVAIIGYTGPTKKDYVPTPVDPFMDGPRVHGIIAAQIIEAALGGAGPMRSWSEHWEVVLLLACVLGGGGLGYGLRSPWLLGLAVSAGLAGLVVGAVWEFGRGVWMPIVPATLGLAASAAIITSWQRYRERQDRMVLMGLFGDHVSDQVAQMIWQQRDEILAHGRLKTENLVATVMFTDLQGFTSVSERLGPQGTVTWLNEYLDRMGRLVIEHEGMINKYMGDAIMAVFGVPLRRQTQEAIDADARAAVACATAMRQALAPLNAELAARELPPIILRVGVFTGPLVAGSVGSTDRLEYTVIGDSVNVASRLESYDKQRMGEFAPGNCRVLIGDETRERLGDRFATRFVAEDEVHNRQATVRIYAVLEDTHLTKGG